MARAVSDGTLVGKRGGGILSLARAERGGFTDPRLSRDKTLVFSPTPDGLFSLNLPTIAVLTSKSFLRIILDDECSGWARMLKDFPQAVKVLSDNRRIQL